MQKPDSRSARNTLDIRKKADVRTKAKTTRSALRAAPPPVPRDVQRKERLRTRRQKKRAYTVLASIVGVIAFIGALGGLSHLEQLSVKTVTVTGVQKIATDALVASVQSSLQGPGFELFSPKNIFLYPRQNIEARLPGEFPRIKNVQVNRASLFAQAVVVAIEERVPFATWCAHDGSCFVMDQDGYLFAPAGDSPISPYIFRGGLIPNTEIIGQMFLRGRVSSILSLMEKLEEAGFHVAGLSVDSEVDFTITLLSGQRIFMAFDAKEEEVMHNLETALQSDSLRSRLPELEYIDLRFGNRVYYK